MEEKPSSTQDQYNPEQSVLEYIAAIYNDMDICINARNTPYPELDNMTPMDYVDESRMRANGYIPQNNVDEYGQQVGANVFFNKTSNKSDVIAGFVAAQRPSVEISARGRNGTITDKRIATILNNAYDYFAEKENSDEIYLDWTIETIDTGTGFLMDYYDYQERIFKLVKSKDWETGKQEYKEDKRIVRDECRAKVTPFESLFWPTFYETDFQNYPFIIYQEVILYDVAESIYGKFPNWKYVKKKGAFKSDGSDGETFYWKRWQERISGAEFVEILHRYDKLNDRHDIIINGVLMTEMDNPMLYDHKDYPFIPQYHEKIKGFILGRSLPMKIMYAQDTFNELMNANINRSRSSSHLSFLSSLESEIESDSAGMWEIVRTDDEANFREMRVESIKSGDVEMQRMLSDEISQSTVPDAMNGEISGDTATAIINAMRQATQNLGPRLIYIYAASKRHAEMRLKNILQFFFNQNLKGEEFEMKEINIEDAKLADGQKGIRIIRVVDSKDKIPPKEEIEKELERGVVSSVSPTTGEAKDVIETNYEIVYITPDDIADLLAKIRIIPGSSLPKTDALEKALLMEMINAGSSPLMQQYPDFKELWRLLVENFGFNPDDLTIQEDPMAAAQQMEGQQAGMGMSEGGTPRNTQLVDQIAGGGAPGLNQLMGMAQ